MLTSDSTTYAYNGDGVLVSQTISSTTTRYTQDLGSPLSQILSDGTNRYVYGHERLFGQAGSTRTWYTSDALGSVRQTLSDSGSVLGTANYDPWGTPQGSTIASFGFTGELQQGGGVYLRARWYTPGSGTLLGRDPFGGMPGLPYSLHPYQYGYSNPGLYTDPSGRHPCIVALLGGGVLGVGCAVVVTGAAALVGASTLIVNNCVQRQDCDDLQEFIIRSGRAFELWGKDIQEGYDVITSGGEGYVWEGATHTGNTEPPPGYTPNPPTSQGQLHPGDVVESYPLQIDTEICYREEYPLEGPTAPLASAPWPEEEQTGSLILTVSEAQKLANLYKRYHSSSYKCVECANTTAQIYQQRGLKVEIVGVILDSFGHRAPQILAKDAKNPGRYVSVATTGYHEVVKIITDKGDLYMDSLVYEHYGLNPVDWETYTQLYQYPEVVRRIDRDPPPSKKRGPK